MKSKIVNHKKDDAVSPVIGVMLMIVVTVVIAAVVALFAGNVVTSTEAAPVVVMEMNAYQGTPDANSKLVMSTRGGDPLELAKLKVVVSDSTGNYDLSFVGLNQRGLGDHLEIGEKLTVFTLENIGKVASSASGGEITDVVTQMKSDFKVGKKLHVMVTFNESAVIFEKDIVIKAGTENKSNLIDLLVYNNEEILEEFFKLLGEDGRLEIYLDGTKAYTIDEISDLKSFDESFDTIGALSLVKNSVLDFYVYTDTELDTFDMYLLSRSNLEDDGVKFEKPVGEEYAMSLKYVVKEDDFGEVGDGYKNCMMLYVENKAFVYFSGDNISGSWSGLDGENYVRAYTNDLIKGTIGNDNTVSVEFYYNDSSDEPYSTVTATATGTVSQITYNGKNILGETPTEVVGEDGGTVKVVLES